MPSHVRPEALVLWPYAQFPFGMGLDYERKFSHYVVAREDSRADDAAPSIIEHSRQT